MDQTIEYYNEHAKEFCESTVDADMSACREKFTAYLPAGGHILDAGCGSGRDSKAFLEQGFIVTAIDASEEVCAEAEKLIHQPVLCLRFEDLQYEDEFDGIWACASLLHVSREEMGDVLVRLKKALKKNGILYASFKFGDQERVKDGRLFNDYDKASLKALMEGSGFEIRELFTTGDVREERADEKWINVIVENFRK